MPFANMQQFAVLVYSNGYDMNHIEITGTIILGTFCLKMFEVDRSKRLTVLTIYNPPLCTV